ncbi:MAG: stage II sporulation protein M [Bacteroidetes bacterium]|nr:stage II sporulation protein M [Bacteroidota bacterium]
MREIAFIKQNKEKWLTIEQVILGKVKKNPDDLSSLYINLINDLSFSQSYYPKSKTTIYLNHLSTSIFQIIYKTKRIEKNRLLHFFDTEVPLLVYQYRRFLVYTFAFFLVFCFVGFISTYFDVDFPRQILGDDYVNMTLENIKKGNSIGVYSSGSAWSMSIVIIFNNLMVAAKMYVGGVFLGIGSLYALLQNSIMLGAFQTFFEKQGVLQSSARGIWVHGVFEISAIIIVAMCGLILGSSILFPKTHTRFQSFQIGFRDSFKIYISTYPFIIVAGILEGFVTRYALVMPLAINLTIIFGTLGIIFYYFVVYPYIIYKKHYKNATIPKEGLWESHH